MSAPSSMAYLQATLSLKRFSLGSYCSAVCLLGLLLFSSIASLAQPITLSGRITEEETGETLIGAAVTIPDLKIGTYTNDYGFFSLSLPAPDDSIALKVVYAGYQSLTLNILPTADQTLNLELVSATLDEVVIEAESFQEQLNSTQMSVSKISIQDAKKIPALFGEVDIIKTLQLKPGVSSGSEGSSGIFVRGGGADQNLVLLDENVVYNPSHLFGFFSTFNADAVKDVSLYKAGFPAEYGGRLSSVIDVKMKEGNRKKFSGTGGLGLIASRLTLEGPLFSDKASFIVSGRRTYVDVITRALNQALEDNENWVDIPDYFFYDFNAKVNYRVSDKDQIFLSGYFGRDRFSFDDDDFNAGFDWGNANATLRWNHFFSPRLFLNTTVGVTDYQYELSSTFDIFTFNLGSRITDGVARADFTWVPNSQHTINFGASGIYHRFLVGGFDAGSSDSTFDLNSGELFFGTEWGAYISDDFEVNSRLKINAGVRLSGFINGGISYFNPEPRLAAKISLTPKSSLKFSYARMAQYLHLVASSGTTLPTDIWYPSTENVKPQISDQVAAGVTIALGEQWLLSNEVYYKWLQNQIDFKDGANLFVNENLEAEFVFGRGWAYGNEFYIEKTKGKLTGWIGYTLSWTWREFDGTQIAGSEVQNLPINDGEPFHPRNDRRHDISIVGVYEINRRLSVSSSWEYRTGNAVTFPRGIGVAFGPDFLGGGGNPSPNFVPIYGPRSADRLPAYHRLDLGLVIKFFPKWGESDLTISAYNAYNRRNVYFVRFSRPEGEFRNIAEQVALFPVIPSVTYNFKF
ncbi:MAG: TonB-dependent receptor [Bacteroidota bacterium]